MAKEQYLNLAGLTTYDEEIKSYIDSADDATSKSLTSHTDNKNNPHEVTATQVGALPTSGGTMTGILYTNASTPLFIGKSGKVGMRAATDTKGNVGQINISNAWYGNGNQWGNQMSAYNGEADAYNEFRVSHNGLEYNCQDGETYQVLHEGNVDEFAATKTYADSAASTAANKVKNDLLNGAGDAYDTLKELGDLIDDNVDAIEALNAVAAGKADAKHTHAISDVTNLQSTLDGKQATITGGATTITGSNLTTNRALISNGSGKVAVSDITNTELGYLDGVTSNIQTQLSAKADSSTLTSHTGNKNNPHGVTAAQVGLGNVNNTSDANKPVSTAQAAAIAEAKKAGTDAQASLKTHTDNKSNPHGVTATQVGAYTKTDTDYLLGKKMDDFSLELYNGTGGNPKPVRFASFNYSTCGSEEGLAVKISMVSGHGNGTSYAFLEDAIIRVSYLGAVEVDNLKYYGASTGTYDGANRQYGDIFWLKDETNKIVDFYVLMGQYARLYQTPWKRLTYSSKGTVTQHTSCTVYSSGTKNWANNSEFATKGGVVDLTNNQTINGNKVFTGTTSTMILHTYNPLYINNGTDNSKSTSLYTNDSNVFAITSSASNMAFNGENVALAKDISALQSSISGKADSSHNHAASNITSGTLSSDRLPTVPVAKGGTGATTAAGALTNLGLTATAAELNKMDGVTATTTELNYVDGVTSNIQSQLDSKAASSTLTSHTSNTSNPHGVTAEQTGALPSSGGNLTGVIDASGTSNILDFGTSGWFRGKTTSGSKYDIFGYSTPTTLQIGGSYPALALKGKNTRPTYNDSDVALYSDIPTDYAASSHTHTVANISDLTATATELNYMDGVTSNVQAQLDSKSSSSHKHSGSDITSGTVAAARLPEASDSAAGIVNTTTQKFKGNKTFTGTVSVNNLSAESTSSMIGNSTNPFDSAYIDTLNIGSVLNNGSVSNGGVFKLSTAGTTTTNGVTTLQLGNSVASGNTGNASGTLEIYNKSTGSAIIRTSHTDSRNIYVNLPEDGGTLLTSDDLNTALNRTTAVNEADTKYTTIMARGSSLNSSETTPTVNGAIAWIYE